MGKRPNYAAVVYGNLIRQVYKKTPVILGGIEASLRRMAHYDYWSDRLRRSILLDSGADLISYGMGERSIVEIAEALEAGIDIKDITFIPGTVCKVKSLDSVYDAGILPSFEELKEKRMNCFMEQAIPELYKYFTTEQREYCSQASSMEEFCRRYREVVKQNPNIIRAYFDEMKAKVGAKDK